MKPWELPVLWTRPADCICGVTLVYGGGLYQIARTHNPHCSMHDDPKDPT